MTARWLNLQRDPRASVLIGGTTSKVTARAATAEEHDRLWPLVAEKYTGYARYQKRTARHIPIVVLTPETSYFGRTSSAVRRLALRRAAELHAVLWPLKRGWPLGSAGTQRQRLR
jgi:hypothetical protein